MPQHRHTTPYLLAAPGLFLAGLIILWPLYELAMISFSEVNRFGHLKSFGTLDNFLGVFGDDEFIGAFLRTGVWTIGIVFGSVTISLPIALILNQDFHGRSLARVIVMLPWAISLTMTAIVWRWALSGESGMLNSGLKGLGIIDQNIQWLASAATAFPVQILIGILVSIPFTVTIFLGGLSSIPDDIYEAAALEGASPLQVFHRITYPLLRKFVNIAVVLNTIYVFNSFPIIWVMTQGGPANSTDILVTYLYKLGFRYGKLGEAAALSIVMFAVLLAFSIIYARLSRPEEEAA